ncbi:tyrosine phosphatase family protein [Roseomonas sp. WA12]
MDAQEPVTVSGLNWALRHKRDFSAVLSLEDPDARGGLRFHRQPGPRHLVLRFVDLDIPPPARYAGMPLFRMADRADIELALEFGRAVQADGGHMLVHCHVGIGRSTAVALAILADRLGEGHEEAALAELLRIRPQAVPNLHVVSLADDILDRGGALLRTVQEWERDRPENHRRRAYNRTAHFVFYGLTLGPDE